MAASPYDLVGSQNLSLEQQPVENSTFWFNLGFPYFLPIMIRE
jgi:hypothetical protein